MGDGFWKSVGGLLVLLMEGGVAWYLYPVWGPMLGATLGQLFFVMAVLITILVVSELILEPGEGF